MQFEIIEADGQKFILKNGTAYLINSSGTKQASPEPELGPAMMKISPAIRAVVKGGRRSMSDLVAEVKQLSGGDDRQITNALAQLQNEGEITIWPASAAKGPQDVTPTGKLRNMKLGRFIADRRPIRVKPLRAILNPIRFGLWVKQTYAKDEDHVLADALTTFNTATGRTGMQKVNRANIRFSKDIVLSPDGNTFRLS